jgi:hypothetical protein
LAAQLGQSIEAIMLGFSWFKANGDIDFSLQNSGLIHLREFNEPKKEDLPSIQQKINLTLRETSSFRSYYFRVDPRILFIKKD